MTERKKLKKQLSILKYNKRMLPLLIDCSDVYGDNYYNENMNVKLDKQILNLEKRIEEIDKIKEEND